MLFRFLGFQGVFLSRFSNVTGRADGGIVGAQARGDAPAPRRPVSVSGGWGRGRGGRGVNVCVCMFLCLCVCGNLQRPLCSLSCHCAMVESSVTWCTSSM
jgi:hypothetical protein